MPSKPSQSTLAEFMRYNNWANRLVLEACQKLSEDQLTASTPGAYGTIRDTLTHLIRAEASYLKRLTGSRPEPEFDWDGKPSVARMAEYAARVGEALLTAAEQSRPTDVIQQQWDERQVRYRSLALFIQIIDHGIEHRTNVTTILNQGLQTPPEVDGWGYLSAHPDRFDFE